MFLLCSTLIRCISLPPCAANGMRSRRRSPLTKRGSMLREWTWRRSIRSHGFSIRKPDAMRPIGDIGKLEDIPPAECEVWESECPLATGQLALPATHAAREQIPEDFLYLV